MKRESIFSELSNFYGKLHHHSKEKKIDLYSIFDKLWLQTLVWTEGLLSRISDKKTIKSGVEHTLLLLHNLE